MKQKILRIIIILVGAAVFAALIHLTLMIASVAQPADNTIYGPTIRRAWATSTMILALAGTGIGVLSMRRSTSKIGNGGLKGARLAIIIGLIAIVSGMLNLAIANGGPGSGNGVVGAATALVLGLIAIVLGVLALGRYRISSQ